jgi:hypothetical protein
MLNYTYPWGSLPLSHDQALRWNSSHHHRGNIALIHKLHCLQFCGNFTTHFSSHQFGIATRGGCETIIHGIKWTLNLHHKWVVFQLDILNAFNLVLRRVIFQEFHATGRDIIWFIPFVHAFYAFESLLFYSHHNYGGDVRVIPFAMGIRQGDPLGGALFALIHFTFWKKKDVLQLALQLIVYTVQLIATQLKLY